MSDGDDEEEDDEGFWHAFLLFITPFFLWDQLKLPVGRSSLQHGSS